MNTKGTPTQNQLPTRSALENLAKKHSLELLGVVPLSEEPTHPYFLQWLREKKHAGMEFLAKPLHVQLRKDPRLLLHGAKVGIVLGLNYYQGPQKNSRTRGGQHGEDPFTEPAQIAQYARLPDYHKKIRRCCEALVKELKTFCEGEVETRITVDTAPILERALAAKSVRGFIGKNTLFIHPEKGSFFIGNDPHESQYSNRRKGAGFPRGQRSEWRMWLMQALRHSLPHWGFRHPLHLDSRKCIAYYTIEHRDLIPVKFWKHLASNLFGCDICQLVCPYNRGIAEIKRSEVKLHSLPPVFDIATMEQAFYEREFGGTPLTRAKISGLKRNALIALYVQGSSKLEEALKFNSKDKTPVIVGTIEQIRREQSKLKENR